MENDVLLLYLNLIGIEVNSSNGIACLIVHSWNQSAYIGMMISLVDSKQEDSHMQDIMSYIKLKVK